MRKGVARLCNGSREVRGEEGIEEQIGCEVRRQSKRRGPHTETCSLRGMEK